MQPNWHGLCQFGFGRDALRLNELLCAADLLLLIRFAQGFAPNAKRLPISTLFRQPILSVSN